MNCMSRWFAVRARGSHHSARRLPAIRRSVYALTLLLLLLPGNVPGDSGKNDPIVLGRGDTIQVYVPGLKNVEKEIKVSEQGTFALPPIGVISAQGRTPADIEKEVRDRLADGYIKNPSVTVVVIEMASKSVMVIGAVKKPGPVTVKDGMSMLGLLSHVNGLTQESSKEAIVIRSARERDARRETMRIPLNDLLAGNIEQDTRLRHGDVVIFPSTADSDEKVNVLGCVNQPGSFALVGSMTLVDLIAQAGGPNQHAGDLLVIIPSAENRTAERTATLSFELEKILSGHTDASYQLRAGDTLMVPSAKQLLMNFFIIGQVKNPGMYSWREGMTVLNAISVAGGLTDKATTKNLRVIKDGGAGDRPPIAGTTSYRVERGDTIVIPESLF